MNKSTIAQQYIQDFDFLQRRFDWDWRQPSQWRQQLERVQAGYHLGKVVAEPLARWQEQLGAGEQAAANARALARPGTVAIVTGQQAGMATGPLYTIYKALATIKIARELAERENLSVIPVFWLASEDHDWLEINHCYWPERQWRWPDPPGAGRRPAGLLSLTLPMQQTIWEMVRCLPAGSGREETAAWLTETLPGALSPAHWVARLLARLLGSEGLVILDPMLPELRQALKPFWQQVLDKGDQIPGLVAEAGRWLQAAGWAPPLTLAEDRVGLFYIQEHQRQPLTVQELELGRKLAGLEPERLSCSVVTRPLAQDRLLPTLAYVAGPGELAYYAQLREVYHLLGQTMPVLLPRWGVTLIEPEQQQVMERWQLTPGELAGFSEQQLNHRLAREAGWLHREWLETTKKRWQQEHSELLQRLGELAPELSGLAMSNWNYIAYQLDYLEKKAQQKLRRQYRAEIAALERARRSLWPGGRGQERVLNLTWFLSRQGRSWLDFLLKIPMEMGRHYYLELGGNQDGYRLYQG